MICNMFTSMSSRNLWYGMFSRRRLPKLADVLDAEERRLRPRDRSSTIAVSAAAASRALDQLQLEAPQPEDGRELNDVADGEIEPGEPHAKSRIERLSEDRQARHSERSEES